jgi:hypothetical protein
VKEEKAVRFEEGRGEEWKRGGKEEGRKGRRKMDRINKGCFCKGSSLFNCLDRISNTNKLRMKN